jgi:hypothetical protein
MLGLLGNQEGPVCASAGRLPFTPPMQKKLSTFFIHSIRFSSSVKPFFH